MRLIVTFFVICILFCGSTRAMDTVQLKRDTTGLPKVFILGEHEKAYEKLFVSYSTMLLEVCNDDMDTAFDNWLSMLEDMEEYANEIGYDIKGIKVWLNIFWENDGSIKHIAYHLKVNSRNIQNEELTAFFSSFMNNYQFPLSFNRNFSHYGSASFPVFARKLNPKKQGAVSQDEKNLNLVKDSVRSKY